LSACAARCSTTVSRPCSHLYGTTALRRRPWSSSLRQNRHTATAHGAVLWFPCSVKLWQVGWLQGEQAPILQSRTSADLSSGGRPEARGHGCIGGGAHGAVLLRQCEPIPQECHEPIGCIYHSIQVAEGGHRVHPGRGRLSEGLGGASCEGAPRAS